MMRFFISFLLIVAFSFTNTNRVFAQKSSLYQPLFTYLQQAENNFSAIPTNRKAILSKLSAAISQQLHANKKVQLTAICTHNSRRSHMTQLWASAAATYYGINGVSCFSGGTQTTAFNKRAIHALQNAGFSINQIQDTNTVNPHYWVSAGSQLTPIEAFSKVYDAPSNPQSNFIAILTCSQADAACPIVKGASTRISLPYEDPKVSDNLPTEKATYAERCLQIATEMLFVFSLIHQ